MNLSIPIEAKMKNKGLLLIILIALSLFAVSCGYRPEQAEIRQNPLENEAEVQRQNIETTPSPTSSPTPSPTTAPTSTPTPEPTLSPEEILWERFESSYGKTREEISASALDSFLWLDGYLYSLKEDGTFRRGEMFNDLFFSSSGQYSCGNAQLDDLVASTVAQYLAKRTETTTRQEILRMLYDHVKNDFSYLVRNYYASGETGWETDEAITFLTTNKGNCYNYAAAFCALCRGIGYNARNWSGTMGVENQPHAWTEVTIDDAVYILDPELEFNYWYLEMYWDFFMIPLQGSAAYNYQAVGRKGP